MMRIEHTKIINYTIIYNIIIGTSMSHRAPTSDDIINSNTQYNIIKYI